MIDCSDDEGISNAMPSITFTSATDYWFTYANANLECICNADFGDEGKWYTSMVLRGSCAPSFCDISLGVTVFLLCPEDFHSQTSWSSMPIHHLVSPVSLTGSPPVLIQHLLSHSISSSVDHQFWDDDKPLVLRNHITVHLPPKYTVYFSPHFLLTRIIAHRS